MRRAAFLDRDGVINAAAVKNGLPHPPATPDGLRILPGVEKALERLHDAGYLTLVVTNQPDVARGVTSRSMVEAIHQRLRAALRLDGIYVCWHDDADRCNCRKPQPGLLLEAARHHNVDLAHSFMIGDRWRDVAAGQKAGCRTIWIKYGYDEEEPAPPIDYVADGLANAVDWILESTGMAR